MAFACPVELPRLRVRCPAVLQKFAFSLFELLFDNFGELRDLFRGQVRRYVLRIRVEQQDHVFPHRPIVYDAGAAALSPRSNRHANLAYPTTTFDESAEVRIRREPGLKVAILLVT